MRYEKPAVLATLTEEEVFGSRELMTCAWSNSWGNHWNNSCGGTVAGSSSAVVVRPCG